MSAPLHLANDELVLAAWVAGRPGFTSAMVGTTLPRDMAGWAANGFVVVGPVIGGETLGDQGPIAHTSIQVSAYAVPATATSTNTGTRPPWGKAADLIEQIVRACYDDPAVASLDLGPRFRRARVLDVSPDPSNGRPTRVGTEDPPIARYDVDLSVLWAELPV